MAKKQSLKDGTKVKFSFENMQLEFEDEYQKNPGEMDFLEGKEATIDCLAMATELGNKDYEYYDITFEDGSDLEGVSGYHLTVIE